MDLDKILAITVSGVRADEQQAVKDLLTRCELVVDDITTQKLQLFLAARKGEELIGTVGLQKFGEAGLLRSLAVEESFRGKGVGKKLLTSMEKFARILNVKQLWLLTMTAADFFSHMGYAATERAQAPPPIAATDEFQHYCPDSAVCMSKMLLGRS